MLAWADSFSWPIMWPMSILLLVTMTSVHYHLTQRVHILYIFDYSVLFHILNEALLLSLLVSMPNWRSSRWLCYRSIFNFQAAWRYPGVRIQHLNACKPTKLLCSKLPWSTGCCSSSVLVNHSFDEICGKLLRLLSLPIRVMILLRNLNLSLLLHLNLNVSDTRRSLTIDN